MKLTFLGANHEVTGSCTMLEAAGQRFLIDYGMEQGKNVYENQPLPVAPGEIDFVLITHAHIDHTGLLPLLAHNGFRGRIYATIPSVELGGMYIDGITIATMAVTAIIMVGLSLFINRTRMGKAMRAVSEDKEAAELMGISVNRTITVTFAIGSALAGVAAIFYGAAYTYIRPTTGAMPGIKAFTAAVFGGIGSIPGAMLGGVLLGVIEQLSKTYISTLWADAIVFGVLVAVLVVKPTGLLGKRISEKV